MKDYDQVHVFYLWKYFHVMPTGIKGNQLIQEEKNIVFTSILFFIPTLFHHNLDVFGQSWNMSPNFFL